MPLFPYQETGVEYLLSGNRRLLFDDPGLGKTAQTITALTRTPESDPTLIVCPAYVKRTWEAEAVKWGLGRKTNVLFGKGQFRWPLPGEVNIVNPDIFPTSTDDIVWNAPKNMRLVFDEVHMYKSKTAYRTRAAIAMRKATVSKGGSVWGLTGSPIMSYPDDLWVMLTVLGLEQDAYGRRTNFDYLFNKTMKMDRGFWKTSWGEPRPEASARLSSVGLGRSRVKVLPDLPTKTYAVQTVNVKHRSSPIEMTDEEMEEQWGTVLQRTIGNARAALAIDKARSVLEWVEAESETHPIVVFTYHTEAAKVFEKLGPVITGATATDVRNKLIAGFQNGEYKVITGTIGAMGVGVTLHKSYHAVFIDRDYQPSANTQAEDRICRIGQVHPVLITDVLSDNKLDMQVAKILAKKTNIINASVEAARV